MKKNILVLSQYVKNNLNAGPKAKMDIETIACQNDNIDVKTIIFKSNKAYQSKWIKLINFIKRYFILKNAVKNYEYIILQTPYTTKKKIYSMVKNKIILIHDIEGLRNLRDEELQLELALYKDSKLIIAHNDKMKQYLVEHGIDKDKIITIDLFDYLAEFDINSVQRKEKLDVNSLEIVYTGNLNKAPFLRQLQDDKMKFKMNVYGLLNNELEQEKIIYKGKFSPDELIKNIQGDIGLIWDGNCDESDENVGFKNYTKYNNPHKLSCYLAAGLPVIVWKKAAVADFVEKNNIGYAVSNIYEINDLDFSDYNEKRKNAEVISQKVRDGFYTKQVLNKVIEYIKNN